MRFAVIGSGKLAVEVCRHLLELEGATVACAIADPRHETAQTSFCGFAKDRGVPVVEAQRLGDDACELLRQKKLDYIISANNHFILKKAHLSFARLGALNFHNGPLPRYAGINPCSWALLNGESSYGVTWHFIDEGIDTGDIIRQECFAIEPNEMAIELIARCIDVGVDIFPWVASALLDAKSVPRSPQDLRQRSYFGMQDRPWNGDFPFWLPRSDLLRLSYALAFWPMPNLFFKPAVNISGFGRVYVGRYEYSSEATMGRIGEAHRNDEGLVVAVDGGSAFLTELICDSDIPLSLSSLPERIILLRYQT